MSKGDKWTYCVMQSLVLALSLALKPFTGFSYIMFYRQLNTTERTNFNHWVIDIAWFGLAFAATNRFLSVFAIRLGASST